MILGPGDFEKFPEPKCWRFDMLFKLKLYVFTSSFFFLQLKYYTCNAKINYMYIRKDRTTSLII